MADSKRIGNTKGMNLCSIISRGFVVSITTERSNYRAKVYRKASFSRRTIYDLSLARYSLSAVRPLYSLHYTGVLSQSSPSSSTFISIFHNKLQFSGASRVNPRFGKITNGRYTLRAYSNQCRIHGNASIGSCVGVNFGCALNQMNRVLKHRGLKSAMSSRLAVLACDDLRRGEKGKE